MYTVALRTAILPFRRSRVKIELHEVLPDRPADEPVTMGDQDRLFKLFHRLGNFDRAILALMMEGYTRKEIGSVLGLREEAVTMRMSRVKKMINALPESI